MGASGRAIQFGIQVTFDSGNAPGWPFETWATGAWDDVRLSRRIEVIDLGFSEDDLAKQRPIQLGFE